MGSLFNPIRNPKSKIWGGLMPDPTTIPQFSVFLGNKRGVLAHLHARSRRAKVNVVAMTLVDSQGMARIQPTSRDATRPGSHNVCLSSRPIYLCRLAACVAR